MIMPFKPLGKQPDHGTITMATGITALVTSHGYDFIDISVNSSVVSSQ